MESVQQQQENGKAPARIFAAASDGTVTVTNGNGRRGLYVGNAAVDCFICIRARNRDDAEQEIEGWLEHLTNDSSSELLLRSVVDDVDLVRVSRAAAAELFGENVALLDPPKPKRCACGAPRDRGRRLCDTCRLERLRERDARQAAERNGKTAAPAPYPGQLELFEPDVYVAVDVVGGADAS